MKKIILFLLSLLMVTSVCTFNVFAETEPEPLTGNATVVSDYLIVSLDGEQAEGAVEALMTGEDIGGDTEFPDGYATLDFVTGIYSGFLATQSPDYCPFIEVDSKTVKVKIADIAKYDFINGDYKVSITYIPDFEDPSTRYSADLGNNITINTGKTLYDLYPKQPASLLVADIDVPMPKVGDEIPDEIHFDATTDEDGTIEITAYWCEWYVPAGHPEVAGYVRTSDEYFVINKTYYLVAGVSIAMDEDNKDAIKNGTATIPFKFKGTDYILTVPQFMGAAFVSHLTISGYFNVELSASPVVPINKAEIKGSDGEPITDPGKLYIVESIFDKNDNYAYKVDENKADTNERLKAVLGEGGYVDVKLTSCSFDKPAGSEANSVVTQMAFEVVPRDVDGNKVNDKELTFRLPVDPNSEMKYANVYHKGVWYGQYEVKTEAGEKYIEVSSSDFSPYAYELTNSKYSPKKDDGGSSGYVVPNTGVR